MAPKQKLKKVVRKRRERKVVERGAAHIRSSNCFRQFLQQLTAVIL